MKANFDWLVRSFVDHRHRSTLLPLCFICMCVPEAGPDSMFLWAVPVPTALFLSHHGPCLCLTTLKLIKISVCRRVSKFGHLSGT